MQEVTAIFDIGKTNKKFLLYNVDLQVIHEEQGKIPEIEDDEGFPCDDLFAITSWIKRVWKNIEQDTNIEIKRLNFTTYGATLVHLDKHGQVLTPLYNYLKPLPEDMLHDFYQKYGNKIDLAVQTASPALGMLNAGLQLYWLKYHKPAIFEQLNASLHFPQYCAYLFSGKYSSELTSIGCHTMLWDFLRKDYHTWVYQENINRLFPAIANAYDNGTALFRGNQIPCGVGLHDSSASLIPYKSLTDSPFVLLSTGTWGIALNPFSQSPLSQNELEQDCLNYMTFEGNPVKASRLFIGNLHEKTTERLADFFHQSSHYFKEIDIAANISQEEIMNPSASFQEDNLVVYSSYEIAYQAFMLDLVRAQVQKIKLILDPTVSYKILFVDGGFAKNPTFIRLLSSAFPDWQVKTVAFSQGTSLGAAMVMNKSVKN
jgi:sugar (pentulose or hexulose) kinase